MLSRNQIVERLFTEKNFNDCLSKMEPVHLQDDLKQEVMVIVCEWPDEKVIKLHRDNALEFYVVRVILNQVKSNSSPFYKKFRQTDLRYVDDPIVLMDESTPQYNRHLYAVNASRSKEWSNEEHSEDREMREQAEDLTIQEIDQLYWYDAEILKLYLRLGSFRAIEDETGIPFISCYKNVKKSLTTLKKKHDEIRNELFTKKETLFIQNNKNAGVLSNTL